MGVAWGCGNLDTCSLLGVHEALGTKLACNYIIDKSPYMKVRCASLEKNKLEIVDSSTVFIQGFKP